MTTANRDLTDFAGVERRAGSTRAGGSRLESRIANPIRAFQNPITFHGSMAAKQQSSAASAAPKPSLPRMRAIAQSRVATVTVTSTANRARRAVSGRSSAAEAGSLVGDRGASTREYLSASYFFPPIAQAIVNKGWMPRSTHPGQLTSVSECGVNSASAPDDDCPATGGLAAG